MNKLSGYHIGVFVSEMDRAEEIGSLDAIVKAARKFHEEARELEKEIFDHVKECENRGKVNPRPEETHTTVQLHEPGHKALLMRLTPD